MKYRVRESHLAAEEMDHIDIVVDVSKATRTAFGELGFAVDALPYRVGDVRFHKKRPSALMPFSAEKKRRCQLLRSGVFLGGLCRHINLNKRA